MSGVSGVSSTGSIPPAQPEPIETDPNEAVAVNFLQSEFVNQMAAIAKERTF